MTPKDNSRISRVQTSFQKLTTAAASLNTISDQLGKVVVELDESLKTLNLGISSWIPFRQWEDIPDYSYDEVGYAKIGGKWGIGIRSRSGDYHDPDQENIEAWLFKDAPRALRIDAIDKIPELLEKLIDDADSTVKRINEKLRMSQELATAITTVAKGPGGLPVVVPPSLRKPGDLAAAVKAYSKAVQVAPVEAPQALIKPPEYGDLIKAVAKDADELPPEISPRLRKG